MITLFFDTETTGKPKRYNAPVSDVDNFPRLVQLGFIVYHDQLKIAENEFIILPEGFNIPKEASDIHGVTQERALAEGMTVGLVLQYFTPWVVECDIIAGHNTSFDTGVVGAEYWRIHQSDLFAGKKIADTMRSATTFCAIPSPFKTSEYKWPKLAELYEKLFNEPMGAAHTALQDIQNTAKCYFEMEKRGLINGQ